MLKRKTGSCEKHFCEQLYYGPLVMSNRGFIIFQRSEQETKAKLMTRSPVLYGKMFQSSGLIETS